MSTYSLQNLAAVMTNRKTGRKASRSLALGVAGILMGLLTGALCPAAQAQLPLNPWDRTHLALLIRGVVDQQLKEKSDWTSVYINNSWGPATFWAGVCEVGMTTQDSYYTQKVTDYSVSYKWKTNAFKTYADSECILQTYLGLGNTVAAADITSILLKQPGFYASLWYWEDTLFMAPPWLAKYYGTYGNANALTVLNREYGPAYDLNYDTTWGLVHRDSAQRSKVCPNGKPQFWSRGNGWVIAGLARILDNLPPTAPGYANYVTKFQNLSAALLPCQITTPPTTPNPTPDQYRVGMWPSAVLDAKWTNKPETSGTGLITYAYFVGVRLGLLDSATYLPAAKLGWKSMVQHTDVNAYVGWCQPSAAWPGNPYPAHYYPWGTGAWLLCASEAWRLNCTDNEIVYLSAPVR